MAVSAVAGRGFVYLMAAVVVVPPLVAMDALHVDKTQWWVWPAFGAYCVVGLIVLPTILAMRNPNNRRGQAGSDPLAVAILEAARASRPQPSFALYLRPFRSDGELVQHPDIKKDSDNSVILAETGTRTLFFQNNLEQEIVRACRNSPGRMPAVHIGHGARYGRVSPNIESDDSDWQEKVAVLADTADAIFFVLSGQGGTGWEADLVAEKHVRKTLFICPPDYSELFEAKAAYETASERFIHKGIPLPPYQPEGVVFFLTKGGWQGYSMKNPRWSLQSALQHLQSARV